MKGFVVLAEAP